MKWEETKITQLICNLFDYEYFSKHYKLIAVDLSKEIKLENPDLKQQINFTGRAAMFFIIEKSEETTFKLLQNAATVFRFDYVQKWKLKRLQTYYMILIMNLENMQQENGMLSMITITQTMVKKMKIVQPLNLKPKSLNQIIVIIQTRIFLKYMAV